MRYCLAASLVVVAACGDAPPAGDPDGGSPADASVDAHPDAAPARGGWSVVDVGGTLGQVTSIWGAGSELYVTAPVFHLASGAWNAQPGATGHALWGSALDDVYLLSEGALWRSRAGGPWQQEPLATPPGVAWRGIWGSSATDIYVVGDMVGDGPRIAHSLGDGIWELETLPPLEQGITQLFGVWGSSANDVYAVGAVGVILHSTGNGTWQREASTTSSYLLAVSGSSATDVYAVGLSGAIVRSTGDGAWTAIDAGVLSDLEGVWASSASDVYAVGRFGKILHSAGGAFIELDHDISADLHSVWGASAAEVYVGGTGFVARRNAE